MPLQRRLYGIKLRADDDHFEMSLGMFWDVVHVTLIHDVEMRWLQTITQLLLDGCCDGKGRCGITHGASDQGKNESVGHGPFTVFVGYFFIT